MYLLNKIAPCETEPEKKNVNRAIMQRNLKTKIDAMMCKATQQLNCFCDTFDDSCLSATQATISSDFKLIRDQCLDAKKTGRAIIETCTNPFFKM